MPPEAHSKIVGGSTAARRIACPGSLSLERHAPEGESSVHALEGTMLHEVMEELVTGWTAALGDNLPGLVGRRFGDQQLTEELARTRIEPALAALRELNTRAGGLDAVAETRVEVMDGFGSGESVFGTIDILARGGDGKLYVVDFKFGAGIQVYPEESAQLGFYTGAAFDTPDEDVDEIIGADIPPIVFVIIQPTKEPHLRVWETDFQWVDSFMGELERAVTEGLSDNPSFSPSVDACRWCKGRPSCTAYADQGRATMDAVVKSGSALEDMGRDQLGELLTRIPQVEQQIKVIRQYALDELSNGNSIPGWGVKQKRGMRVYTDANLAETRLRRKLGVKGAFNRKLISPAQSEKKVNKKWWTRNIAPLVETRIPPGLNLVQIENGGESVRDGLAELKAAQKALKGVQK